jgi:Carboxypeptidase regulatory-like domain
MRPAVLLLATFFLLVTSATAQSTKTADAANKDDCSISGMVVKLAGSEPLKSASVQLQSTDDRGSSPTTVHTDSGGHFELRGIQAGRYLLRVMRTGFVSQQYGQRTPSGPGAILALSPGQQMNDLLFRLIPSATISGRVENEDGEPLPWAHVSALRQVYAGGSRTLSMEETVPTNDRGEYRLFGLRPGRYFLAANYRPGGHQVGQDEEAEFENADSGREDYVRTFYPGVPDASKAEAIAVKAGEEIPSMDFLLQPVAVYKVRGHVHNLVATSSKSSRNHIVVQLQPKKSGIYNTYSFGQNNFVNADGTFDLDGVLPGSYILSAQWFDDGKRHYARQSIEVGNADVEGVQLTIAPGMTVSGHVRWEGSLSPAQNLVVMAQGVDEDNPAGLHARVDSDGSFTLNDAPDLPLRVSVYGQSQDSYLKAVTYGGVDSLEDGFTARAGVAATLEVTLSSRGAHVQGSVINAEGLPAVGVCVVLVPDGKHRTRLSLYKEAQTDQRGQFLLRGISPGDYTLFSWNEVEVGAWEDPDFLKAFEDRGEKVTVQEGEAKSINLTAIGTASTEEQKP